MAKGPNAFRTISETAEVVGVPQHVLRFWETKFAFVDPVKRAGGRRFYRPQDVAILQGIRRLLHDEGLTIKGVQRLHREQGMGRIVDGEGAAPAAAINASAPSGALPQVRLTQLLAQLEGAKRRLDAALDA